MLEEACETVDYPRGDEVVEVSFETTIHSCSLSEGHSFRLVCEKEVRSVLGHHCSAVSGSEVVYGRELQARPIRKLQMLLRLIRIGMGWRR